MELAVLPPLVKPAHRQFPLRCYLLGGEGGAVPLQCLFFDGLQPDSFNPGRGPSEVLVDKLLAQSHGLEYLGAPVAL